MNKQTIQSVALAIMALLLGYLLYQHFFAPQKLGYVDSARLIDGYEGMKNARKDYEAKAQAWKANLDTLAAEFEAESQRHAREVGKMSAKERSLSEGLMQAKQQQFAQYQQAIQQKAQAEDDRMTQAVLQEVNAYMKQYGQKHGYRFIFAATQVGNIAYADEAVDLTDKILEGLNGK